MESQLCQMVFGWGRQVKKHFAKADTDRYTELIKEQNQPPLYCEWIWFVVLGVVVVVVFRSHLAQANLKLTLNVILPASTS